LPSEVLLIGVLLIAFLKFLLNPVVDKRFIRHPITIIIILQLVWIFITSLTSEMPLISLKYFFSRLWFVIPFYFIGVKLFKEKKNIKRYIWLYVISLTAVVIYTLVRHYIWAFDDQAAHWVMSPFFTDHTSYGAILSFIIPVMAGFAFNKANSRQIKYIAFAYTIFFIIALYFSSSRAAWVSIIAALSVFMAISLKIKFRWIALVIIVFAGLFFSMKTQIIMNLEGNRQETSTNFTENVQSISNISSDASNLERINRWECALRMFKERPVFGWGPGTYQFVYAPFQISYEKTIISSNAGDMGTAHNEYLGPLSESGLIGMLLIIALVIASCYYALTLLNKIKEKEIRLLLLVVFLGLVTYFVHGLLNNFLDTDKASALFWGFIAIIVSIDIYHRKDDIEIKKSE